jgi:hypothetical protein
MRSTERMAIIFPIGKDPLCWVQYSISVEHHTQRNGEPG